MKNHLIDRVLNGAVVSTVATALLVAAHPEASNAQALQEANLKCELRNPSLALYFEREIYRLQMGSNTFGGTIIGTLRAAYAKPPATSNNPNPVNGFGIGVANRMDGLLFNKAYEVGRADLRFGNYSKTFVDVSDRPQLVQQMPINGYRLTNSRVDLRLLGLTVGNREDLIGEPKTIDVPATSFFNLGNIPAFDKSITVPAIPVGPVVIEIRAGLVGLAGAGAAVRPVLTAQDWENQTSRIQAAATPRVEAGGYAEGALSLWIIRGGVGGLVRLFSANAGPGADFFLQDLRVNLRSVGRANFLSGRIYGFVQHKWWSWRRGGFFWKPFLDLTLFRFNGFQFANEGIKSGQDILAHKEGPTVDVPSPTDGSAVGGYLTPGGDYDCDDCREAEVGDVQVQTDDEYFGYLNQGAVADRIEILPGPRDMFVGEATNVSAVGRDANGEIVPGVVFRYSSQNTSIAQFDQFDLLTAMSPGEVIIEVRGGGKVALVPFRVRPAGGPPGIVLPPSGPLTVRPSVRFLSLLEARSRNISVQVKDELGRDVLGQSVSWSSNAPSVVAVSSAGDEAATLQALSAGQAVITARVGDYSASISVNVSQAGSRSITLHVGERAQVKVTPKDASGQVVAGKAINWTSNSPAIVSFDLPNGVGRTENGVTGRAPGQAYVTVECDGFSENILFNVVNPQGPR
jgi:hypothetical protein